MHKKEILIIGMLALVLLTNTVIGIFSERLPLAIIYRNIEEFGGWNEEDLIVTSGGYTFGLIGSKAHLELKTMNHNQSKIIYIEISKPMHLLNWSLSEYREIDCNNTT